ncbi:MAG TPA: hypothetical protein VLZ81_13600, partial [Blastocatellia bacterium]|nr:hypothetical protein [Blastocatellia bacterium]
MHSLFYVLSSQHGDDLAPMPCNAQTVARLVRHLEDVVNENNLPALVIEGRCLDGEPARETERLTRLCGTARHVYLFSCDTSCEARTRNSDDLPNLTSLEEEDFHSIETGPFILVMDSRFCGLLASYRITNPEDHPGKRYELIWTFDPNVAFTALEYLMARISVQNPSERERVESLLTACTTRSSSSRIALTFNTKLAMLLQRQNDLETAISSISSAISSTLDLETILQSAVEEVGRALKARHAALVLWEEDTKRPEKNTVYERDPQSHLLGARPEIESGRLNPPIKSPDLAPGAVSGGGALDGPARRSHAVTASEESMTPWPLEIPISYRNNVTGLLEVEDDTPGRQWESEEVLM